METDPTTETRSLTLELCLFNVGPCRGTGPRPPDRAANRAGGRIGQGAVEARADCAGRDEQLWLAMTSVGAAALVVASHR